MLLFGTIRTEWLRHGGLGLVWCSALFQLPGMFSTVCVEQSKSLRLRFEKPTNEEMKTKAVIV